jgi:Tfp pilus assembly protein PilO
LFIVFIVFLLGLWFFIVPKYRSIFNQTVSPKEKAEEQYLEKNRDLTDIKKLISAYNNISATDKEKIYLIIPDEVDTEGLIRDMEDMACNSGLVLESVRAEAVAEKSSDSEGFFIQQQPTGDNEKKLPQGVGAVKIEVNLIGTDYYSLKDFLKIIENNLRLFDVDSISFDPVKESTNLKITTYYLKN